MTPSAQKYLKKVPQYTRNARHLWSVARHGTPRKLANLARVEFERKARRIEKVFTGNASHPWKHFSREPQVLRLHALLFYVSHVAMAHAEGVLEVGLAVVGGGGMLAERGGELHAVVPQLADEREQAAGTAGWGQVSGGCRARHERKETRIGRGTSRIFFTIVGIMSHRATGRC